MDSGAVDLLCGKLKPREFLEDYLSDKTPSTCHTYTGYLNTFLKWYRSSGADTKPLPESEADVEKLIDDYVLYKHDVLQNSTTHCNNTGWCLTVMLLGKRRAYKSPIKGKKKTKGDLLAAERKLGRRQLTDEEHDRLVDVLLGLVRDHKNETAAAYLFMLGSGARFIELYTLTVGALRKLATGEPAIVRRKGDEDEPLLVTKAGAEAASFLLERVDPAANDDDYVYRPDTDDPYELHRLYNNAYCRMLKAFKRLDAAVNERGGSSALHILRRSFGDRLYGASNKDLVLVSRALGHKTPKNVMRYVGNDWQKTARLVADMNDGR